MRRRCRPKPRRVHTSAVAPRLPHLSRRPAAQGRDDLGRPLLQRALRIQEAQLGPDHPDVQAIRDVLDEEG